MGNQFAIEFSRLKSAFKCKTIEITYFSCSIELLVCLTEFIWISIKCSQYIRTIDAWWLFDDPTPKVIDSFTCILPSHIGLYAIKNTCNNYIETMSHQKQNIRNGYFWQFKETWGKHVNDGFIRTLTQYTAHIIKRLNIWLLARCIATAQQ